jgi:small-conductance mechanosensitive channel
MSETDPQSDKTTREDRPLWRGILRLKHHRDRRSKRTQDFLRAGASGAVALAAVIFGSAFGNVHGPALRVKIIAWAGAVVFVVSGVIATRCIAKGLGLLVSSQTIPAAGAAVRLLASATGYVIVLFAALGVLDVSIEHLIVGGAVTGVVLGIAAQQSLGNVFSGLVLLLARPFSVGDHIRIRSGALGGIFDGVVLAVSLTYVTIQSEGGPLKIPNSTLLAAAVGPYVPKTVDPDASVGKAPELPR